MAEATLSDIKEQLVYAAEEQKDTKLEVRDLNKKFGLWIQTQNRLLDRQKLADLERSRELKKMSSGGPSGGFSSGGGGLASGFGGLLGGIGKGLGVLSTFVGIGGGIAALGVGIGGFFTGISAADAAIGSLGTGENLKTLLTNVGAGISSLDAQVMAGLGVLLGTSALFGAATGPAKQFKAATGMTMIGLGIGGFMAGLAAAGDLTGFTGEVFAAQSKNLVAGIKEFSSLNAESIAGIALIAGSGALVGSVSTKIAGKATIGMGLAGFGIGSFMTGIAAAGDLTGFKGDTFKTQMKNVVAGFKEFETLTPATQVGLTTLAGLGAIAGAANPALGAFAAVGMGLAGFGIGSFMTGIAASGDITGFKGDVFAAQAKNIADGLSAFSGAQLGGLSALMVTGGILGATGLGNVAAGGAALGMGLVGLGIGAFISGIAGAGEVASWMGADGSGIKTMLTNIGGGLKEFDGVNGANLQQVGDGIAGLGAGLLALMAEQGLGGITKTVRDAFTDAWNWLTGNDEENQQTGRFDKIIEELQAFNGADFSGISNIANLSLGVTLGELGTGLLGWTELRGKLPTRELTNFINGPLNDLVDYAQEEGFVSSMDEMGSAVGRVADSFKKFNDVNLRELSRFSFEDFAHDFAIAADGIDKALNGGTFTWGTNVRIRNGLASPEVDYESAIENIRSLRAALGCEMDQVAAAVMTSSPVMLHGQEAVIPLDSTRGQQILSEKAPFSINRNNRGRELNARSVEMEKMMRSGTALAFAPVVNAPSNVQNNQNTSFISQGQPLSFDTTYEPR